MHHFQQARSGSSSTHAAIHYGIQNVDARSVLAHVWRKFNDSRILGGPEEVESRTISVCRCEAQR